MLSAPFFHPELLSTLDTFPRTSDEWNSALDRISDDIKNTEALLRSQFTDAPSFRVQVGGGTFELKTVAGNTRLCFSSATAPEPRAMIELSVSDRLQAYRQFPELFERLAGSDFVVLADAKAKNVASKTVFEIIKEAFERVKVGAFAGPKLERLVDELKRLRLEAPKDDSDLKSKAGWFRRLADVLLSAELMQQVFAQVRAQIPQIWSQLTFSQKLKVGAIAPIVGAGAYLGGIGVAGGGGAVGVPVVLVVLLLLMMNHSLVDFLDYLIKQLSLIVRNQPSPDAVSKVFEEVLNATIKSVFGKDHDVGSAERVDEPSTTEKIDPRGFETLAVSALARKFGGVGYLTRYSSDGGIDGYIVCEASKEVILVQAKHYSGKVGFPEVTQYLGTYFYWKKVLEPKFPYPISRMALACSTDYSIEARKVADAFKDQIVLERVPC